MLAFSTVAWRKSVSRMGFTDWQEGNRGTFFTGGGTFRGPRGGNAEESGKMRLYQYQRGVCHQPRSKTSPGGYVWPFQDGLANVEVKNRAHQTLGLIYDCTSVSRW